MLNLFVFIGFCLGWLACDYFQAYMRTVNRRKLCKCSECSNFYACEAIGGLCESIPIGRTLGSWCYGCQHLCNSRFTDDKPIENIGEKNRTK